MSDIKLLIEIPEEEYNIIKKSNAPKTWAEHLIAKGIPLPKGHRFIDADEILNHAFITEDEEGDVFVQKYYCIKKEILDNALVLFDTLELDKSESEST